MASLKQKGEAERLNSYLGPFAYQLAGCPGTADSLSLAGVSEKDKTPTEEMGPPDERLALHVLNCFPIIKEHVERRPLYSMLQPGIEQVCCVLILCWPVQYIVCCCLASSRYAVSSFCVGQNSILRAVAWLWAWHIVCCCLVLSTAYCVLLPGFEHGILCAVAWY